MSNNKIKAIKGHSIFNVLYNKLELQEIFNPEILLNINNHYNFYYRSDLQLIKTNIIYEFNIDHSIVRDNDKSYYMFYRLDMFLESNNIDLFGNLDDLVSVLNNFSFSEKSAAETSKVYIKNYVLLNILDLMLERLIIFSGRVISTLSYNNDNIARNILNVINTNHRNVWNNNINYNSIIAEIPKNIKLTGYNNSTIIKQYDQKYCSTQTRVQKIYDIIPSIIFNKDDLQHVIFDSRIDNIYKICSEQLLFIKIMNYVKEILIPIKFPELKDINNYVYDRVVKIISYKVLINLSFIFYYEMVK